MSLIKIIKKLAPIKKFFKQKIEYFFLKLFILNFITLLYKRITIHKYSSNHLLNLKKKNGYQSFPKA